jgi:hypothetical protein
MVEWLPLFDKMKDPLRSSRFPNDDHLHSGIPESVRTIPKDCLVHLSGSCQKNGNGPLTPVGSMWSVQV